jgi:23S rRNA (adenine2503-C2)-methyltransferase
LAQVNDTSRHADELAEFVHDIDPDYLVHVNLIRYNTIGGDLRAPSRRRVNAFRQMLAERRVNCTIRRSVGDDIAAACGQLAGQRPAGQGRADAAAEDG